MLGQGERLRKTWLEVVRNDMEELGLDLHAWKKIVEDLGLPEAPLGFFLGFLPG